MQVLWAVPGMAGQECGRTKMARICWLDERACNVARNIDSLLLLSL